MMAAFEAHTDRAATEGEGAGRSAAGSELAGPLQQELADYLALQRRIAEVPLPEVAPSVRSAIMNAAVAQADLNAACATTRRNPLADLLAMLLRPGPVLIGGTLAALAVSVAVRQSPKSASGERPASAMVALDDRVGDKRALESPEPAAAAAPAPQPAAPPAGAPPAGRAVPRRTFAATPASLGPADTPNAAEPDDAPADSEAATAPALKDRALAARVAPSTRPSKRKATVARRPSAGTRGGQAGDENDLMLNDGRRTDAPESPSVQKAAAKPAPTWSDPPAKTGKGWPLKSAAKKKLTQDAFVAGRNRAEPSSGSYGSAGYRSGTRESAPDTVNAAAARASASESAPAEQQLDRREFAPPPPEAAPAKAPPAQPARPQAAPSKAPAAAADEDGSKDSAGPVADSKPGELARLRDKLDTTKTESTRVAVLQDILRVARKTGDLKTERWASGELKRIAADRAQRTAEQAASKQSKTAGSKTADSNRAKSAKSAKSARATAQRKPPAAADAPSAKAALD